MVAFKVNSPLPPPSSSSHLFFRLTLLPSLLLSPSLHPSSSPSFPFPFSSHIHIPILPPFLSFLQSATLSLLFPPSLTLPADAGTRPHTTPSTPKFSASLEFCLARKSQILYVDGFIMRPEDDLTHVTCPSSSHVH